MTQARRKAKTGKAGGLDRFRGSYMRFLDKSKLSCIKGPVFWVLAFYVVKGTAVTIAGLAALYFVF